MEERDATITLRIEKSHKAAFERIAAELDQTSSQMIRKYIRHVINEHAAARAATAQGALELHPEPESRPAEKKPAKGQRLAAACAVTARGKR